MIQLKITSQTEAAISASVKGELDTAAVEPFNKKIKPLLEASAKQITLDFSKLEFISSAGMRSLLVLQKATKSRGGDVTIVGMKPELKEIFHLVGFDTLFHI